MSTFTTNFSYSKQIFSVQCCSLQPNFTALVYMNLLGSSFIDILPIILLCCLCFHQHINMNTINNNIITPSTIPRIIYRVSLLDWDPLLDVCTLSSLSCGSGFTSGLDVVILTSGGRGVSGTGLSPIQQKNQ